MVWNKVGIGYSRERYRVEEKEAEDNKDGDQNAVPKLAIHGGFDCLLPLGQILHGQIERI